MERGNPVRLRRALISVWRKDGVRELAKALAGYGVEILSTGGTATHLEEAGLTVRRVEAITEFPEMLEGRVKTLHPRVFAGILARRDVPGDLASCERERAPLVDLVVVNLYPFEEHGHLPLAEQTAYVDIGGPSLIRAAAKNFRAVTVLSSPDDYSAFLQVLHAGEGSVDENSRFELAVRSFERTAAYDATIANRWSAALAGAADAAFPATLRLPPRRPLRYGENPHQRAAWCSEGEEPWTLLQGKELSYNNLADADAACRLVAEFSEPATVIVKHNTPCGVATGGDAKSHFERAFQADSLSAFGGVVATNRPVDAAAAEAMAGVFLEVVVAPDFTPDAQAKLAAKKNLRLVRWPKFAFASVEVRPALGGWLVQDSDQRGATPDLKVVTKTPLPPGAEADLRFAWLVAKHARSNAVVLCKGGQTVGVGAGQVSRVESVEIALKKAQTAGGTQGTVLASEAFFPFRDNIDKLKGTGVRAIIQPGGSQRDAEVIAACDEHGIAMAFTGERHFRH